MRFIATASSVVSVCWWRSSVLQKQLNRSRCRFWTDSGGPKEPLLDGVQIHHGKVQLWGCRVHWKALGIPAAAYAAKEIIQSSLAACSWRGHSVFSNGTTTTCDAAFRQNSLDASFVLFSALKLSMRSLSVRFDGLPCVYKSAVNWNYGWNHCA